MVEPACRVLQSLRWWTLSPIGILRAIVIAIVRHPDNRGHYLRAVARTVLGVLSYRITGTPVVTKIGNSGLMLVRPRLFNTATAKALYGNPPDYFEITLLQAVIRRGDLFVDVGANVGIYALIAAEAGARVIAIEPGSDINAYLERNVRLNAYDDRVTIRKAAAANTAGQVLLTQGADALNWVIEDEQELTDPIRRSRHFWTERPTSAEVVEAIRIDDLVGNEFVAAMKLDVEGQELGVIEGARVLLREQRVGYLQVENNASSLRHYGRPNSEVWDHLREAGYQLYGLSDHGMLFHEPGVPTSPEVIAVAPSEFFWARLNEDLAGPTAASARC